MIRAPTRRRESTSPILLAGWAAHLSGSAAAAATCSPHVRQVVLVLRRRLDIGATARPLPAVVALAPRGDREVEGQCAAFITSAGGLRAVTVDRWLVGDREDGEGSRRAARHPCPAGTSTRRPPSRAIDSRTRTTSTSSRSQRRRATGYGYPRPRRRWPSGDCRRVASPARWRSPLARGRSWEAAASPSGGTDQGLLVRADVLASGMTVRSAGRLVRTSRKGWCVAFPHLARFGRCRNAAHRPSVDGATPE